MISFYFRLISMPLDPMDYRRYVLLPVSLFLVCFGLMSSPAKARPTLKNICHVKGQEENTLQGLGLVVGLTGTGDGGKSLPTSRALATAMKIMGSTIGKDGLLELKNAKNVALVIVTATVPAAGGRQGDKLDCVVSAISAKSLAGLPRARGGKMTISAGQ